MSDTKITKDKSPKMRKFDDDTAIMICGHGSRDNRAVDEFKNLSEILKKRFHPTPVEYGFLEFATPIINDGLKKLMAGGAKNILAVPGMLFAAGHAKNDIPSVLNSFQARHKDEGVQIHYGRELGIDAGMLKAASARIDEALAGHKDVGKEETMLVVVGRGASDPDANSNVAKVTRLLWEGFGFGWAETVYSGVTFPLVKPGLEKAVKLGFKRIIVFPYFLFNGVLVQRIYDHCDMVAQNNPDIEFIKAGYLNDQPSVVDVFVDRVYEILDGENLMNCQMCKYRTQILGFEDEVGLAQESHHHHVEGINESQPHSHSHSHSHSHAHNHDHHHKHGHGGGHHHDHHDHHHHPYPHKDHPLGPNSLKNL